MVLVAEAVVVAVGSVAEVEGGKGVDEAVDEAALGFSWWWLALFNEAEEKNRSMIASPFKYQMVAAHKRTKIKGKKEYTWIRFWVSASLSGCPFIPRGEAGLT